MTKRIIILIIILILVGFGIYFWKEAKPPLELQEKVEKEVSVDRSETFEVSGGGDFPVFTKELYIDPYTKVKQGEKQTFSIWAKDLEGIEKVTATISTDKGDEIIEMQMVDGSAKEGKWLGSWTTRDISSNHSYLTVFLAENQKGETTKLTISWTAE